MMAKIVRLYTENKNRDKIIQIIDDFFGGATFYEGLGLWMGDVEHTFVIEMTFPEIAPSIQANLDEVIRVIKDRNEQTSIMVVIQDCEVEFK